VKQKFLRYKFIRSLITPFFSPNPKVNFVFIVGCYNSGTTLLNHFLSLHSEITGLHTEGVQLTDELTGPEALGWNRMWCMCRDKLEISKLEKEPDADRIKRDWALWFERKKNFWLEKSIVNSLNIDWFEENFNRPYFISIVRNGYAVSEGIRRRTQAVGKHPASYPTGYPIELCARQWVVCNQVIQEKIYSVQHFIEVTYEDLTENPADTIAAILKWLPVKDKTPVVPDDFAFQGRIRKIENMNRQSIEKLRKEEINAINEVAREMLEDRGYKVIEPDS
jgi:hypothetical protein